MRILYSIAIRIFVFLCPLIGLFNKKIKKAYNVRKGLLKKIENDIKNDNTHKAWFHAASLGEFEQGRPVIEAYKKANPEVKIVLTFFSPSGYDVRKNYEGADYIYYLPFDTNAKAKKFVELVNPIFAVYIKYEYWLNTIYHLAKKNIPLYSISSIFRPEQAFFKPYGLVYRKTLNCFTYFFVQNEESSKLLNSIGLDNVTVTGDTRFDRVMQIVNQAKKIDIAGKFVNNNNKSIVAGSTWPPDEEIIARYVDSNDGIKLIIAPHEINSEHINKIKKKFTKKCIAFSEVSENTNLNEYDILIIDNIGMLSSLYRYGQVAYIGGGFGVGIHNTLEAATYGIPVIFGPNYKKFAEAIDLINIGAAFSIDSLTSFTEIMNSFWSDAEKLKHSGSESKRYVIEKSGATRIILEKLNEI